MTLSQPEIHNQAHSQPERLTPVNGDPDFTTPLIHRGFAARRIGR